MKARLIPVESNGRIRRATTDDFDGITRLFTQVDELHLRARPDLFRETDDPARPKAYLDELLANDDSVVFVAEASASLVGFVVAFLRHVAPQSVIKARTYALLDGLVVDVAHRRSGVGTMLVRAVESWAREHRSTSVELAVHEFNAEARTFYERLGYEVQLRKLQKGI